MKSWRTSAILQPDSERVNQPGTSLEQLLSALARKGIPLPFEMGTFMLLEATERVLALGGARSGKLPVVSAGEVWLGDTGEIALEPAREPGSEGDACRALVRLLGELLVRSATGVPAMLLELAEQGPSDGQWSLSRLRDDLEASLVPLNRAATRRVLGRLLRETRRDVERGGAPLPDAKMLDRELDVMLGLPSESRPAPAEEPAEIEIEEESELPATAVRPPKVGAQQGTGGLAAGGGDAAADFLQMPLPKRRGPPGSASEALDEFERAASGHGSLGTWIGIAFVVLAAALVAAYLMLGRS